MDVSQLIHEDACQCMLHNCQLWDKLGQKISGHEASNGKVVALYFTSNWCEPCHTFTRSFVQVNTPLFQSNINFYVPVCLCVYTCEWVVHVRAVSHCGYCSFFFSQAYDGIQHRTNELTVVNIPLENDQSQADLSYSRMPPQWFTMEVESKQTK